MRKNLYLMPALRRRGPARLRLIKNGADGSQAAGGDNGGGNSGGAGNSGGDSNNTGDQFNPDAFWGGSDQAGGAAPNGESAGSGGSDSGNGSSGDGGDVGQLLTQQLQSMSFGDPIFTPEVAEQINNGDFNGVQERFNSMGQTIVRQSLGMMVQILRPFAEQLQNQMREEFSSTLTGRDNEDQLIRDFPAAKDPRVAPVVKQVFQQALKNTNGNRERAVSQTKEMMRLMAGQTADDLNLNVAPRGADDSGRPANTNFNWLDELASR